MFFANYHLMLTKLNWKEFDIFLIIDFVIVLSRPTEEAWPLDHREGLSGSKVTKVERAESERALLNLFLARVNKIDPDIVVGHDIASYDLDILLHRFSQNKVQNWSRLGRLRRTNIPQSKVNITYELDRFLNM